MKPIAIILSLLLLTVLTSWKPKTEKSIAEKSTYLEGIKKELNKEWPANPTINLVFHGHSVPAGYFKTPTVNTLDSYPYQVLKKLKERYPYAVINVINTAIGGEDSDSGADRFDTEVLTHRPDVLFIDYSLNDRRIGLESSYKAWDEMIRKALQKNIKVILLTPSPDQRTDILDEKSELERHRKQVIDLAKENGVGLVDSYQLFRSAVQAGNPLPDYMSQVNHPNKKGHQLIMEEAFTYFE